MAPLHTSLFSQELPRNSTVGRRALQGIGDWYIKKYHSYIQIYSLNNTPDMFPKFVPNRLMLKEIAYQTGSKGIANSLAMGSKRIWPTFPINVGRYFLQNVGHDKAKA